MRERSFLFVDRILSEFELNSGNARSYEERLEELDNLVRIKEFWKGDLRTVFRHKNSYKEDQFFSVSIRDRASSSGLELQQQRFRLGFRRNFLALRMVKPWNRSSKEAMEIPSLQVS